MSVPEPPKYVGINMWTRILSVDPIHKPIIRFPSLRAREGEKERDRERERERRGRGRKSIHPKRSAKVPSCILHRR